MFRPKDLLGFWGNALNLLTGAEVLRDADDVLGQGFMRCMLKPQRIVAKLSQSSNTTAHNGQVS